MIELVEFFYLRVLDSRLDCYDDLRCDFCLAVTVEQYSAVQLQVAASFEAAFLMEYCVVAAPFAEHSVQHSSYLAEHSS